MEFKSVVDRFDLDEHEFYEEVENDIEDYFGDRLSEDEKEAVTSYYIQSVTFKNNLAFDVSYTYDELDPRRLHDLTLEFSENTEYESDKLEEDNYKGFTLSYLQDNKTKEVEIEKDGETIEAEKTVDNEDLREALATAIEELKESDIDTDAYDPKVISAGLIWIAFSTSPKPNGYRPMTKILDYFKFKNVEISSVNLFLHEFKEKCFFPKPKYVDSYGIYKHMNKVLQNIEASEIQRIQASKRFHELEGNVMDTVNSKALACGLCYAEESSFEEVALEANRITVERIYRRYIDK